MVTAISLADTFGRFTQPLQYFLPQSLSDLSQRGNEAIEALWAALEEGQSLAIGEIVAKTKQLGKRENSGKANKKSVKTFEKVQRTDKIKLKSKKH